MWENILKLEKNIYIINILLLWIYKNIDESRNPHLYGLVFEYFF